MSPKAPAAKCCIDDELARLRNQVKQMRQKAGVEVPVKLRSWPWCQWEERTRKKEKLAMLVVKRKVVPKKVGWR
jgi:hypothetical protein